MYNSFYRTDITDNEVRKYLDVFLGPSALATSMLGVVQGAMYTFAVRIGIGLLVPDIRQGTINLYRNLTFDQVRKTIFARNFLLNRFFRALFQLGIDLMYYSTFWVVTGYKKLYIDPPPEKPTTTTAATTTTTTTTTSSYGYYSEKQLILDTLTNFVDRIEKYHETV